MSAYTTIDPLGLERCAICANAFVLDADAEATEIYRRAGGRGFVCRWCAARQAEELERLKKLRPDLDR